MPYRMSWDTRTRTRNDRTRICSVTITPYPKLKIELLIVGIPGLEPGMTGPESVVLPLHHIPISANEMFISQLRSAKVLVF